MSSQSDSTSPRKFKFRKLLNEDQIVWSNRSPQSLQKRSFSTVNNQISTSADDLKDLKVDPILSLEKKYNTNFLVTNQTPSKNAPKGSLSAKLKIGFNSTPNIHNRSPMNKRSKSLETSSSKLFKSASAKECGSDVFRELMDSLKQQNNTDSGSSGNNASFTEILDNGIKLDDFEDDFDDDFFDESKDFVSEEFVEDSFSSDDELDDALKVAITSTESAVAPITVKTETANTEIAQPLLKDIKLEDESVFKDPFENHNMARAAISKPWLHRYQIVDVFERSYTSEGKKKLQKILKVKDRDAKLGNLVVRDCWVYTEYTAGEVVHVISDSASPNVVDSKSGNLLILNPDTLVSATSLGESLNCERKSAVLARFNIPGQSSKALIVGNIIHQVIQKCLQLKKSEPSVVEENVKKLIEFYSIEIMSANETAESIWTECQIHLPYVEKFLTETVTNRNVIRETVDVEESIWSPIFGLRGLVDVSFITREQVGNETRLVVPLEIKTGKNFTSHNAQAAIYTLLMRDHHAQNVDHYYLLYSKLGTFQRHSISKSDLSLLLVKRNDLSKALKEIRPELPDLVKNSTCDRCFVKDECMMLNKLIEDGSEDESGFKKGEFSALTDHVSGKHAEFYKTWENLLNQEENFVNKMTRQLWVLESSERENSGQCLGNLVVKESVFDPVEEKYRYKFVRQPRESEEENRSMETTSFTKYESILISDEKNDKFAIASALIQSIRRDHLTVSLRKRLTGEVFRIDKNPAFHGLKLARYNLLEMFMSKESLLRDIVVDAKGFEDSESGANFALSTLNPDQNRAINKCLSQAFTMILGMPGTGKTTVITELITHLIAKGKTVLVAAYTHSALDNILCKLVKQKVTDFVRLGNLNRIHPEIRDFSPLSHEDEAKVKEMYFGAKVVAATCLGINDWIFQHRNSFDYCIVDEASQVSLPICLGPLRFGKKFVLVGDHHQLPPLVQSPAAKQNGLATSLFKMLCENYPEKVAELSYQYRMSSDIMMLSNVLVYGNRLKCGSEAVATNTLQIRHAECLEKYRNVGVEHRGKDWLQTVFEPENRVIFLNHDALDARERVIDVNKMDNPIEVDLIYQIVEAFVSCGVSESSIGVMSLYRSQIRSLNRKLFARTQVEVLTADKFQGLDKECIIISLVRSNDKQLVGELLKEWRRINVAITRAKSKLIIVGSRSTLQNLETLNEFLRILEDHHWIYNLPANALSMYSFLFEPQNASTSFEKTENESTKISDRLLNNHLVAKNILSGQ